MIANDLPLIIRRIINICAYIVYTFLVSIAFSFIFPLTQLFLWKDLLYSTDPFFTKAQIIIAILVFVVTWIFRKYFYVVFDKNLYYSRYKSVDENIDNIDENYDYEEINTKNVSNVNLIKNVEDVEENEVNIQNNYKFENAEISEDYDYVEEKNYDNVEFVKLDNSSESDYFTEKEDYITDEIKFETEKSYKDADFVLEDNSNYEKWAFKKFMQNFELETVDEEIEPKGLRVRIE